jgi:hypothetical protein
MKQSWQWTEEALGLLGYSGTNGSADRERAVEVVVSLLKEQQQLRDKLSAGKGGEQQ